MGKCPHCGEEIPHMKRETEGYESAVAVPNTDGTDYLIVSSDFYQDDGPVLFNCPSCDGTIGETWEDALAAMGWKAPRGGG